MQQGYYLIASDHGFGSQLRTAASIAMASDVSGILRRLAGGTLRSRNGLLGPLPLQVAEHHLDCGHAGVGVNADLPAPVDPEAGVERRAHPLDLVLWSVGTQDAEARVKWRVDPLEHVALGGLAVGRMGEGAEPAQEGTEGVAHGSGKGHGEWRGECGECSGEVSAVGGVKCGVSDLTGSAGQWEEVAVGDH